VVGSATNVHDRSTRRLGRGGRPKADEAQRRNEQILRAAGETFMRLGFNGASMDAVAAALPTMR